MWFPEDCDFFVKLLGISALLMNFSSKEISTTSFSVIFFPFNLQNRYSVWMFPSFIGGLEQNTLCV
jgi:hypothetical protein